MGRPGGGIWRLGALAAVVLGGVFAEGQVAPPAPKTPLAAMASADAQMDAAEALIGRALFLRGFPVASNLSYDLAGRIVGATKPGDWTLAGMDVKHVERRGPKEIELDGVRVAILYNTDNHQFERHPQKDDTLKVLIADAGNAHGFEAALEAVFAQGIDPRLQQSLPAFWQHYFNPGLTWPQDALTGQTVYALNGLPDQAKDVTPPSVVHKVDAKMTSFAERDKIHGTLQLRMVVNPQGVPQRITVARPLGYGLEERAVEAVAKWRFTPAMRQGQPVAAALLLNYDFEFVAPPHP